MDPIILQQLTNLNAEIAKTGQDISDPVAKLMASALMHQTQKIKDMVTSLPERVADKLAQYYLPIDKLQAQPALALVQPSIKIKKDTAGVCQLTANCSFTYKIGPRQQLSFYPIFRSSILAFNNLSLLTPRVLKIGDTVTKVLPGHKGLVWLGLEINSPVECLEGVSFMIKGTSGLLPRNIYVGDTALDFASAAHIESLPMAEPFDAQQLSAAYVGIVDNWKKSLAAFDDCAIAYIIDDRRDRDVFKSKAYPKSFQQMLESNDLDKFSPNTLWIMLDFGPEYEVPDSIEIMPNVVPVTNVNINTVTLTLSSPIEKLNKEKDSFFLKIIETSTQAHYHGFDMKEDEIVLRDFDASTYDSEALYCDVRRLYNRFVEDYYAFIDYNGLKDGELVKSLRETINAIGRSISEEGQSHGKFDQGTYVMRNVNKMQSTYSIRVSYLTTNGRLGNTPKAGQMMENKKDAGIEKDVLIVASAVGGEDKASIEQRLEMLRYYTLTVDRLFTKMDVDAFVRLWLLQKFGAAEMKRISYEITVQGIGSAKSVSRGLYIDIRFRDSQNYQRALAEAMDRKIHQEILNKSCLTMPVVVTLVNNDKSI